MRWGLLLALALTADAMADPLAEAETRFRALSSYQVTLRSTAADGERQVVRYAYRQPGWVRMDFAQPHRGMVLVYDPDARQARLWPFGLGHWPTLRLAPDNPLLRGRHGHRVDRSDVGALLANLQALRARGRLSELGDTDIAARPAAGFEVVGDAGVQVAGVHRYRVWLARGSRFPIKVESFDASGEPIETVDMADVETDVAFPEHFFAP